MEQDTFLTDAEEFSHRVPDICSGTRLDHFLVQTYGELYSRSQIISSIKSATVKVNNRSVKAGYRLKRDDLVSGFMQCAEVPARLEPQPVDFDVIHEDNAIIALVKPAGLVVHPGSGNQENTLVNGLIYRYGDIAGVGDEDRPGIVHRLDKDTSGILLVARTIEAQKKLMRDFKDRKIDKTYIALVHGVPGEGRGRIVAPIGRHSVNRQKMAVRHHDGRFAATNWKVEQVFARHCLLEIGIETGRTHQIRVHMAHIGHPVAGDRLYGPNRQNDNFPRQMLHAWRLCFNHPVTEKQMRLEAPIPHDMNTVINTLGKTLC